jgi:hypothetical protein
MYRACANATARTGDKAKVAGSGKTVTLAATAAAMAGRTARALAAKAVQSPGRAKNAKDIIRGATALAASSAVESADMDTVMATATVLSSCSAGIR